MAGRGMFCATALMGALIGGVPAGAKQARNMKAIPVSEVTSWFGADDYPASALRASRQGRVVALVESTRPAPW